MYHSSSKAPRLQKAVVVEPHGRIALRDVPVPMLGPTEVLVKVQCAGQIPTDCLCYIYLISFALSSLMACDIIGQGKLLYTPEASALSQAAILRAPWSPLEPTFDQACAPLAIVSQASSMEVSLSSLSDIPPLSVKLRALHDADLVVYLHRIRFNT